MKLNRLFVFCAALLMGVMLQSCCGGDTCERQQAHQEFFCCFHKKPPKNNKNAARKTNGTVKMTFRFATTQFTTLRLLNSVHKIKLR